MGDVDNKVSVTLCNQQEMEMAILNLHSIEGNLGEIYNRAINLPNSFMENYEGEAADEVMQFLTNFPTHIEKLSMLYKKMAQFTAMTLASLQNADDAMVQNMGN